MPIRLEKSEIFKGLTSEEFWDMLQKGERISLRPKTILFQQDDIAERCFLVAQGRLKLTKFNEHGREVIIRYIGSGELAAAIAVLRNQKYPVSAECVAETEVFWWDKPSILHLMRRYPDIAINLLGIVFERIDEVQHRYLEICTESVDQRIARSLLRFMRKAGVKTSDGIRIDFPLSRQNVADYCGTTLFTVSRTLSNWEKKGWIKSGREKIIIQDPHALVLFAQGF